MLVMYELADPLFVQWVQVMTEWNGFYVHWSLVWTRRLPKGIMVVHQLPPYFGVVQFGDGHGMWSVPFSPHFYFFFFFCYGALGFPLCNYYLVAAWHALWPHVISRLVRRSLVLVKLFSFPRFLRRFLFKPLVFSLCTYFCKTPVILCLSAPNFQLPLDFTTVTSALISSPFQFRFLFQLPHFTFFFLF